VRSLLLGLLAVMSLSATESHAAPMFQNGSFASGFTDWTLSGSPDLQSFGFDDNRSVGGAVFSGGGAFETISQVVSDFTIGQSYAIDFYQQNNGSLLSPYNDGRASWQVLLAGSVIFRSALMDPGDVVWERQTATFVANATSYSIEFKPFDIDNGAALSGDTGVYPVIDLVSIHVVPEPSTALLLSLGIVGLAARRKRLL